MRSKSRLRSLRTKIIGWTLIPTMIILVAVAVVIFYAYQDVTEDLVVERNQDLARLAAGHLVADLAQYADLLDAEARSLVVYQGDLGALRDALKGSSRRLAAFNGGVLILDTFGKVVAAAPGRPDVLGQNWADRAYYRRILRSSISGTPERVFSDIMADGTEGTEAVVVAVPMMGSHGELSTLLDISHNVASHLDLSLLLGVILDQLKSVVDYDGASILTLDGDSLKVLAYRGPIPEDKALELRFTLDEAKVNLEVIKRGEPVIIPDVRGDTPLAHAFQQTAGGATPASERIVC